MPKVRRATHQGLRDRIKPREQLDRLMEIAEWLKTNGNLAGEINPDGTLPVIRPEQVVLADKEINLRLKLLNKVLPDLKAVEHSGEIDTGQRRLMSVTELKHRVGIILQNNEPDEIPEMLPSPE